MQAASQSSIMPGVVDGSLDGGNRDSNARSSSRCFCSLRGSCGSAGIGGLLHIPHILPINAGEVHTSSVDVGKTGRTEQLLYTPSPVAVVGFTTPRYNRLVAVDAAGLPPPLLDDGDAPLEGGRSSLMHPNTLMDLLPQEGQHVFNALHGPPAVSAISCSGPVGPQGAGGGHQ